MGLAAELEIEQSSVSRIERGAHGFDSLTLYRITNRLAVPASALFAKVEGQQPAVATVPAEAVELVEAWLSLPLEAREQYKARITALALAYKAPVPDERVRGALPTKPPRARKLSPKE